MERLQEEQTPRSGSHWTAVSSCRGEQVQIWIAERRDMAVRDAETARARNEGITEERAHRGGNRPPHTHTHTNEPAARHTAAVHRSYPSCRPRDDVRPAATARWHGTQEQPWSSAAEESADLPEMRTEGHGGTGHRSTGNTTSFVPSYLVFLRRHCWRVGHGRFCVPPCNEKPQCLRTVEHRKQRSDATKALKAALPRQRMLQPRCGQGRAWGM